MKIFIFIMFLLFPFNIFAFDCEKEKIQHSWDYSGTEDLLPDVDENGAKLYRMGIERECVNCKRKEKKKIIWEQIKSQSTVSIGNISDKICSECGTPMFINERAHICAGFEKE